MQWQDQRTALPFPHEQDFASSKERKNSQRHQILRRHGEGASRTSTLLTFAHKAKMSEASGRGTPMADPNRRSKHDKHTPLHSTTTADVVDALLAHGADGKQDVLFGNVLR
jgi:hypothetical protein